MGVGDNIMASGMARGADKRGKKVAFGDGRSILWDHNSEMVFRGNPNVAPPSTMQTIKQLRPSLEWVPFYRGNRLYNKQGDGRWIWNYEFKAKPGEFYFDNAEMRFAERHKPGFVVIEPNVPEYKSVAPNKQWPIDRYQRVANRLIEQKLEIVQFIYGSGHQLVGARQVKTQTFRQAAAVLSRAALYIGPEGGMHHAAAAVGVPAVVLFGGFIPPQVTGYDTHANLTGGAEACGSLAPCNHCKQSMHAIKSTEVIECAEVILKRAA